MTPKWSQTFGPKETIRGHHELNSKLKACIFRQGNPGSWRTNVEWEWSIQYWLYLPSNYCITNVTTFMSTLVVFDRQANVTLRKMFASRLPDKLSVISETTVAVNCFSLLIRKCLYNLTVDRKPLIPTIGCHTGRFWNFSILLLCSTVHQVHCGDDFCVTIWNNTNWCHKTNQKRCNQIISEKRWTLFSVLSALT